MPRPTPEAVSPPDQRTCRPPSPPTCGTAGVDPDGRIHVPRAIRDGIGLRPGARIDFEVVPEGLLVHVVDDSEVVAEEGVLVYRGKGVCESDPAAAAVKDDRERRIDRISGPRRRR